MFRLIVIFIAVISILLLLINYLDQSRTNTVIRASIPVTEAISTGEAKGFRRAERHRTFSFPQDHGSHPEFQSEWWYFTGNLKTAKKQHFGYQVTLFRQTLSTDTTDRESQWASNKIYMGHLAVTDVSKNKFYAFERLSRGVYELAGTRSNPFKIWLENWEVEDISRKRKSGKTVFKIVAQGRNVALELTLTSQKPEILQGEKGLSKKGAEPGNASYYYSLTRLQTEGKIILENTEFDLSGWSWMDREWSTAVLTKDQIGWDWFSLQLDNNQEIMYYQLRKKDGSIDPFSAGEIIYEDGSSKPVSVNDIKLNVTNKWENPQGIQYPSGWNLRIPEENLELTIKPYIKNQELKVSTQYWEGAVNITGEKNGKEINGSGYVELTGYKEQAKLGQ